MAKKVGFLGRVELSRGSIEFTSAAPSEEGEVHFNEVRAKRMKRAKRIRIEWVSFIFDFAFCSHSEYSRLPQKRYLTGEVYRSSGGANPRFLEILVAVKTRDGRPGKDEPGACGIERY